jgi:hypothetical protein
MTLLHVSIFTRSLFGRFIQRRTRTVNSVNDVSVQLNKLSSIKTDSTFTAYKLILFISSFHSATAPGEPRRHHYQGFTIALRSTPLGRTPLDEWSAPHRDLYLTTHNTHKRQTTTTPPIFEPAIPVSERPQIQALDRTATGIGKSLKYFLQF